MCMHEKLHSHWKESVGERKTCCRHVLCVWYDGTWICVSDDATWILTESLWISTESRYTFSYKGSERLRKTGKEWYRCTFSLIPLHLVFDSSTKSRQSSHFLSTLAWRFRNRKVAATILIGILMRRGDQGMSLSLMPASWFQSEKERKIMITTPVPLSNILIPLIPSRFSIKSPNLHLSVIAFPSLILLLVLEVLLHSFRNYSFTAWDTITRPYPFSHCFTSFCLIQVVGGHLICFLSNSWTDCQTNNSNCTVLSIPFLSPFLSSLSYFDSKFNQWIVQGGGKERKRREKKNQWKRCFPDTQCNQWRNQWMTYATEKKERAVTADEELALNKWSIAAPHILQHQTPDIPFCRHLFFRFVRWFNFLSDSIATQQKDFGTETVICFLFRCPFQVTLSADDCKSWRGWEKDFPAETDKRFSENNYFDSRILLIKTGLEKSMFVTWMRKEETNIRTCKQSEEIPFKSYCLSTLDSELLFCSVFYSS